MFQLKASDCFRVRPCKEALSCDACKWNGPVNGPVQIEVPLAESNRLDQDKNISETPEPMDFGDFHQPNMTQNDRNILPTSSILYFSVDYTEPLWPADLHESSLADPEPAEDTVGV